MALGYPKNFLILSLLSCILLFYFGIGLYIANKGSFYLGFLYPLLMASKNEFILYFPKSSLVANLIMSFCGWFLVVYEVFLYYGFFVYG